MPISDRPTDCIIDRLPERIRFMRKKSGLSQEELATRIGISRTFLTLIESGLRTPSMKTLNDLMTTLTDQVGERVARKGWWGKIPNGDHMAATRRSATVK